MCSGRVDFSHVLRAFSNGADGVFIGACHLNDCHYITDGNYSALGNVFILKKIMENIGLNPERLRLESLSAGEGIRFAEVMNEFNKKIKDIGPLGESEGMDENTLKSRLEAVNNLVPYIRLVERERMRVPVKSEEAYRTFFTSDGFNRVFDETIGEKMAISQIISILREGPLTTGEIANVLGLTPSEVSRHLNSSSRQRFVRFDEGLKRYALA
jgi:coenzyme F420-reducing hydrogenase delta subunit